MKKLLQKLSSLGSRQGKTEEEARKIISEALRNSKVSFKEQKFSIKSPKEISFSLQADGKEIPCLPSTFVSGKIDNKYKLVDTYKEEYSGKNSVIAYNSKSTTISRHSYFQTPALTVPKSFVAQIKKAKNIEGEVKVKMTSETTVNFLAGNLNNPRSIVFTHFDSIGPGAIDNASGTAIVVDFLTKQKGDLSRDLFVISGNEELSQEWPIYWGFGYRVFQEKYSNLLKKASQLIIVDSVGCGKTVILDKKSLELIKQGFPIKNLSHYGNKTFFIAGNLNKLMPVYHSDLDIPETIDWAEIERAQKILSKKLS